MMNPVFQALTDVDATQPRFGIAEWAKTGGEHRHVTIVRGE